jgi:multidrug efflux system membrane fusion protein
VADGSSTAQESKLSATPAPRLAPGAPKRRRRWLPWFLLVLVAAGAVTWGLRARRAEQPAAGRGNGAAPAVTAGQARPIPVTVATVSRRDVPVYLQGLGNVVAYNTVTVRSQVDGRLQELPFKEGQTVKRGQVLAQIDPRPFIAAQHQAEGALARDEAQLANARLNLKRFRALRAENLVAQQQVDDQAATVAQLEGAVGIDHAAVETARLNVEYARITSPIDGVVGIRAVDVGNLVRAADTNGIVVVTQLDPITVLFTLPQDHLAEVSTALARGPLPVDAYARDGAALLGSGELAVLDNQINQATSTIRLKAVVPNPKRLLWPNQFVNARLRLSTNHAALVVPAVAIQRGPSGSFVYVIAGDGTAEMRRVETTTQGDLAIVSTGLNEGERVAVEGQSQLRPGARVAVREPQARPAGAAPRGAGPSAPPAGGPAR